MDTILGLIARAFGGSAFIYILIEIIGFLIIIWILYAIIKNAVKNAVIELRKELNYTFRKALLESKADIESGIQGIPDYISRSMSFEEYKERERHEQ